MNLWRTIFRFALLNLCATLGAILLGGFVPNLVYLGFDREISSRPWLNLPLSWFTGEPVFFSSLLAAAGLSYLINRKSVKPESLFVWCIPTLLLAHAMFKWLAIPHEGWPTLWDNFFGTRCQDSECLYELTATAPFYCSVVFSLVAGLLTKPFITQAVPSDAQGS